MQTPAAFPPSAQPDLSVYLTFPPEKVLPFFYGQSLYLPLQVWQALQKEDAEAPKSAALSCRAWLRLIRHLGAEEALRLLEKNPGLQTVGPFYHLPDKVSFFFPLYAAAPVFSAAVLAEWQQVLEAFIPPAPELSRFLTQRPQVSKRRGLSSEELLKELALCQTVLAERQRLQTLCGYVKAFAANCAAARMQALTLTPEPVLTRPVPETPVPREREPLRQRLRQILSPAPMAISSSPERHTYFLSLRLYDQACTRYKEARGKWPSRQESFYRKVAAAEKKARAKLALAEKAMQLCASVLEQTVIHPCYQQPEILSTFAGYLETGRAAQLKACINLYEEERHWQELKTSQHRIEQTILSWQDPEKRPLLDSETLSFLQSVRSLLKDA